MKYSLRYHYFVDTGGLQPQRLLGIQTAGTQVFMFTCLNFSVDLIPTNPLDLPPFHSEPQQT